MEHQRLHDPIDVAAIFTRGIITPKQFRWQAVRYHVDRVNQRWQSKNGGIVIRYFAVSVGRDAYKLAFHTKNLMWTIEEVYRDESPGGRITRGTTCRST